MRNFALVFLGGGIGAACRWGLQLFFAGPYTTFAINVSGSFLIGYIAQKFVSEPMRTLVCVGVLGGFTTFSTFAWDTLQFDSIWKGAAYVAASVFGAIALCTFGRYLAMF